MDTSTFSLQEACRFIKPIKDNLSFIPLSKCLETTRRFGSLECKLIIWPAHVTSPLGLTGGTMVFPLMFIKRMFFESADFRHVKGFTDHVILAEQGMNDPQWLHMRTKYVQQGEGIFYSEPQESIITRINDVSIKGIIRSSNASHTFPRDFLEGLIYWVAFSTGRRLKNIDALKTASDKLRDDGLSIFEK